MNTTLDPCAHHPQPLAIALIAGMYFPFCRQCSFVVTNSQERGENT